jgi:Leucine-rich repeat (LRR) protein
MIEQYGVYFELAGVALLLVGGLWAAARALRRRFAPGRPSSTRAPLIALGLGLFLLAGPPVYMLLVPIDLGPRDKVVAGERHLTLTGWDRKDYSELTKRPDVVVLQMANPDVTDATLAYLKGLDRLKELDLNDTKITDEGLKILKDLPALATLRLKNTKITNAGFRDALAGKESLRQLDLTGTAVDRETVEAWKKAKPGRRAMQ